MTESLDSVLAPYTNLSLSAFDNTKLVVALIYSTFDACEAGSSTPSTYEASLAQGNESTDERYYLVRWQAEWIMCGRTNSYAASIRVLKEEVSVDMSSLRELTIPVMSMQQVSFMCMENAHFDHC